MDAFFTHNYRQTLFSGQFQLVEIFAPAPDYLRVMVMVPKCCSWSKDVTTMGTFPPPSLGVGEGAQCAS